MTAKQEQLHQIAQVIFSVGSPIEVRILPTTEHAYFQDPEQFTATLLAKQHANANFYVVPNPVTKELYSTSPSHFSSGSSTKDEDISHLYWLLVDIDPIRFNPDGTVAKSDIATTDAEKKNGLQLGVTVVTALKECGWPAPLVIDSGNGYQLWYRTDLPNTPENAELRKNVLATLDQKYSNKLAEIDLKVYNASRLFRLPGTVNHKGPANNPDRPHRMSVIFGWPPELVTVSKEQLQAVAAQMVENDKYAIPVPTKAQEDNEALNFDAKMLEKTLDGWGLKWKRSHYSGGYMYRLPECPIGAHDNNTDATHIFLKPNQNHDGYIRGFKCFHASCDGIGWKEFRAQMEQQCPKPVASANAPVKGANVNTVVPTATKSVDIPTDPNPPFPEDCMYGWLGDKAKELETPLGFSYPAMLGVGAVLTPPVPNIRSNMYVSLLGGIGTGKSQSIERAISTIAWQQPEMVNWGVPGSDVGLYKMFHHDEPYPKAVLLAQDELKNMIESKMGIKGAALPYVLCQLWNKDSASGHTKGNNDLVLLRLSLLGALKCDDAVEFQTLFGKSTTDGLTRRFIFGVAPQGWVYSPPSITPEPMPTFYSVQVPLFCYDLVTAWRNAKNGRSNWGELVLRTALISSFMNHDESITEQAMTAAFKFMEWQEQIREIYKAGKSETKEAEVEAVIMNVLEKVKVGETISWTKLYKNRHLDRKGSLLVNRVRDSLWKEGMIGYDPKTKEIWRKD